MQKILNRYEKEKKEKARELLGLVFYITNLLDCMPQSGRAKGRQLKPKRTTVNKRREAVLRENIRIGAILKTPFNTVLEQVTAALTKNGLSESTARERAKEMLSKGYSQIGNTPQRPGGPRSRGW